MNADRSRPAASPCATPCRTAGYHARPTRQDSNRISGPKPLSPHVDRQPDLRHADLVPAAVITASASILVAVLLFVLNQSAQLRQERRQARLARVNSQLRELYGPLNAIVDINERVWEALRESRLPAKAERRPGSGTPEWRRWRDLALMPANQRMRDLIIERADLLVEAEIPQPLRDFCAHVASLEVVMAAQKEGLAEQTLIAHPAGTYVTYVRDTFMALKGEQHRLLKLIAHSPSEALPHTGPGPDLSGE
jgi:hypothetical protein